ncbi:MAG: RNA polymerase sigma-70 factor [Alistipes sp.]
MPEYSSLSTLSARKFGELFLEYKPGFIKTACRYVRDWEVAADLVSDSFIAFWETRATLPDDVNIPAYILTIVKNKCLNHLRAQSQHSQTEQKIQQLQQRVLQADIESLIACDPNKLFQKEIFGILQHTLEKMPAKTREIYEMSRVNGMNYNDIADKMGITFSHVHFEIRRSLQILRKEFKDYLITIAIIVFAYL